MLCCIDKTLNGWNTERVASICRERCGGQGFLSVNKFGDYLSLAHSALTAEGDNRVLMVKIVKDMITNITKKGHKLPELSQCPIRQIAKSNEISDLRTLLDLLKFREVMLFEKLMKDTKDKLKSGKSKYEVLMRETSDSMQELAQAYGERVAMEYCMERLANIQNAQNKKVLTTVFQLFALDMIDRDLHHYILYGVVNNSAASKVQATKFALVKQLAPNVNDLFDCMSIPKHALYAPIAGDYVKYNASPNYGEIVGAKL